MINKNIECEAIYAVGDVHGYFSSLVSMIKRYEIKNSCIIICGDCGLGFYNWDSTKVQLKKLNDVCKKTNNTIVMFRGNHDDPDFFTRGNILSNIMPVPDYTVINNTILCVGGATSIDRQYRIKLKYQTCSEYLKYHPGATLDEAIKNTNNFYWENEAPVYNEEALNEIKDAGLNISVVCTHTCPSFCDPTNKDGIKAWIAVDPELESIIDNERAVMDKIYDKLKEDGHQLKDWIYGHYHRHNMMFIDDIRFLMLDAVVSEGGNVDWCEININQNTEENG